MANTPGSFSVDVGGAGTTVFEETTAVYTGGSSLSFKGDAGSTKTKITQQFGSQTSPLYRPRRKYAIACRITADAGVVAGVMVMSVQNEANAVQDSSSLTIDLTGVSTGGTWDLESLIWESGDDVPSVAKLAIELTTAITNTKAVYVDELILTEMPQLGAACDPWAVGLRGATDFVAGVDEFTCQITNNGEGELQAATDRWFDVHHLGRKYQLPSTTGGAETEDDAWIS